MAIATETVEVIPDTSKFGTQLTSSLNTSAKNATASLTRTLGTVALGAFAKSSVQAFLASETAQLKLNNAVATFPQLAGANVKALQELNSALALKTGFDDDATAAAEAQLAQFDLTEQQIRTLIPLIQDYARFTQQDLGSATSAAAKALLGQGRALKTIGIDFQDAGSKAANFDQLVTGLSTKVGGFAEQFGTTAAGQVAIFTDQIGELQESIGAALVPVLQAVLPPLRAVAEFLRGNEGLVRFATQIGLVTVGFRLLNGQLAAFATRRAAAALAAQERALLGTSAATGRYTTSLAGLASAANVGVVAGLGLQQVIISLAPSDDEIAAVDAISDATLRFGTALGILNRVQGGTTGLEPLIARSRELRDIISGPGSDGGILAAVTFKQRAAAQAELAKITGILNQRVAENKDRWVDAATGVRQYSEATRKVIQQTINADLSKLDPFGELKKDDKSKGPQQLARNLKAQAALVEQQALDTQTLLSQLATVEPDPAARAKFISQIVAEGPETLHRLVQSNSAGLLTELNTTYKQLGENSAVISTVRTTGEQLGTVEGSAAGQAAIKAIQQAFAGAGDLPLGFTFTYRGGPAPATNAPVTQPGGTLSYNPDVRDRAEGNQGVYLDSRRVGEVLDRNAGRDLRATEQGGP